MPRNYRAVARNNLTDLEQAIAEMRAEGYEIDWKSESPSLLQVIWDIDNRKPIGVPMWKEKE